MLHEHLKPDSRVDRRSGRDRLPPPEREPIQLVAEGSRTNKEVAVELGISVKTTESHRTHLMHKLGLRSVSELVRYAVRNKIIEA